MMKHGRRLRRVSWSVWLITTAIVLLLGSLIATFSYRQFISQTEARLRQLLQEVTLATDAHLNGHIAVARLAAATQLRISCYELSGADCRAAAIPASGLHDAGGGGVIGACPNEQWLDRTDRVGTALGPVGPTGSHGGLRAALTVRFGGTRSARFGGLCLDVDRILGWWRNADWPPGSEVALIRSNGDIWMTIGPRTGMESYLAEAITAQREDAGLLVTGDRDSQHPAMVIAWSRSKVADLTLVAGFTTDAGLAAWSRRSRPLLIAIALSVLVFPLPLAAVYGRLAASNREIRRHVQRLNLAVDSGAIGVWEYDPETDGLEWNDQMFRIFGVDPETFGNHIDDWRRTCHPDDVGPTETALAHSIENGTRFQRLFRIRRKTDGATRWIQAYAEPSRDDGGTVVSVIGLNWDVTRDIENKAELGRRLAEAKEANAAKDRFLATLSHELRTPLNAIIGFTDLMRSNIVRMTSEKRDQYLEDVHYSARHLLNLINDMLDLARINNDALDLASKPVDLGDAIETLPSLTGARTAKGGAGPRLVWDIPDPAPVVIGDVRAIQQILINIVGNALKFTPPDGRVTVTTAKAAGGMIDIAVKDTGIGIPPERLPLLGEPFAKGDAVYQANEEGVGLGLAITKRLAEAMGGRIAFESQMGKGTKVTVTLPGAAPVETTAAG